MVGLDFEGAYDALFGQFLTVWQAQTPAVNGNVVPEVIWPDSPEAAQTQLAKGELAWCRVTAKHDIRKISSIGFGGAGQGRIENHGTIMVNIFVPAGKRGLATAARLGKVALAAFEGQRAGDIWFTDVMPQEAGVDGPWFQYNVKARFHYDNHL